MTQPGLVASRLAAGEEPTLRDVLADPEAQKAIAQTVEMVVSAYVASLRRFPMATMFATGMLVMYVVMQARRD